MLSSSREIRMAEARIRELKMSASPAAKAAERLVSRLKRRGLIHEGTDAQPGEYLVHVSALDGLRRSVCISDTGELRWLRRGHQERHQTLGV